LRRSCGVVWARKHRSRSLSRRRLRCRPAQAAGRGHPPAEAFLVDRPRLVVITGVIDDIRAQLGVAEELVGKCNHSGVIRVQALGSHPGSVSMARILP